jgi:hypothetical protein
MKHSTRALIRHLYFVEHVGLDDIANELCLRRRTVRRALVLPGGAAGRRRPEPTRQETEQ